MDDKLRKAIEERAYALWEQAGRPEGSELAYWFQAEGELVGLSVAGEEDPLVAVDDFPPGEALRAGPARAETAPRFRPGDLIGRSPAMVEVYRALAQAAPGRVGVAGRVAPVG